MKDKLWWWLVPVVVLCGVAVAFYFTHRTGEEEPVAPSAVQALSTPVPDTIQHPVPADSADTALPALEESDQPLLQAFAHLLGDGQVQALLVPMDLVRHIVATVDNLPRKKVAQQVLPVKPVPGTFATDDASGAVTLSPQNWNRYAQWMKVVESTDTQQLVNLYFRFYPLFQQAYRSLGYPNGYFNDRVVEAIDDALTAPELNAPVQLVQPSVMYQYANPELEARSAGQKILLRMGNENALRLKRKLREVRAAITREEPRG